MLLDRTLLMGDSTDTSNNEVVFDLPTLSVHDLLERAARCQEETEREQVNPTVRITVDLKWREGDSMVQT
jgi:hypothetical protein